MWGFYAFIKISYEECKKKCQNGRLQKCNNKVLRVSNFGENITFNKNYKLFKSIWCFEIYFWYCMTWFPFIFLLFFFIKVTPVCRGYSACFRGLSALGKHFGLDNIEYLFRIHITADVTFALIVICLFNFPFEILY